MLEWVVFVGILFLTGWILHMYAARPFAAAAPAPMQALAQPPTSDPRDYTPQSWCLAGENTLGRFCVESDRCKGTDRFPSREACEYTEASALPLGVTKQGGLFYTPFMTREDRMHTF